MKKFLLCACAFAAVLSANAQYERLRGIEASDGLENEVFYYNEDGSLDYRYREELWVDGFIYQERLVYNEKNQVVRDETWQDLEYIGEYVFVNYCEYGYDDQGRMAYRDNYNSWDNITMNWCARIVFEYDEQGHLAKEVTYWPNDLNDPFMEMVYEYDAEGKLSRATERQQDYFSGGWVDLGYLTYKYDAKGRMISNDYFYYENGEERHNSTEKITYTGDDITRVQSLDGNGIIHEQYDFFYDNDVAGEYIFMPSTPEWKIDASTSQAHKRTTESIYLMNNNTDQLTYSHDLTFTYEPNDAAGLTKLINSDFDLRYSAAGKAVSFGNRATTDVRVTDMSGATVLHTNSTGHVDLSTLPQGNYIVSAKQMLSPMKSLKINVK